MVNKLTTISMKKIIKTETLTATLTAMWNAYSITQKGVKGMVGEIYVATKRFQMFPNSALSANNLGEVIDIVNEINKN